MIQLMKKTFLSIAILASSIFAFAATNTPSQSSTTAPTEQTVPAKEVKEKKNGKKANRKDSATEGRRTGEGRLFEGLNLTENQKERLAALKEKTRADRAAAKKDGKKDGKERSGKLTPEQREQMKAQKTSDRRAFLAGVKEILTPEQYITFLENNFSAGGKDHKMHKAHNGGSKKHDGNNKRHDRKRSPSAKKDAKTDKNRS